MSGNGRVYSFIVARKSIVGIPKRIRHTPKGVLKDKRDDGTTASILECFTFGTGSRPAFHPTFFHSILLYFFVEVYYGFLRQVMQTRSILPFDFIGILHNHLNTEFDVPQ